MSRLSTMRCLALLSLSALLGASALGLAGCIDSRGSVEVPAGAAPLQDPAAFDLPDGTSISLERAVLVFEDVLFEEPSVALAEPRRPRWRGVPLIRSAHAHAGHDYSGAETGELLGRFEVDLTAGAADLGTARLLEGTYSTARLLWPGNAPAVTLQGTATPPGGAPIPFAFAVQEERTVTNMPFVAAVDPDAPPTALHLTVDLARILGSSDWTTPDTDGDGVLTEADGELGASVRFGARTSAAYTWEIEP